MIRKNVASQTVYLPQLRLTADGSAVTTGASLVVAKDGVEAAAAGTLAHYAGGIWKYTPTQAETDCAILALILTATGADTVLLNILTTAANPQDATAFGITNLNTNTMADAILSRNVSNVEATAPEHCLATIILSMLEHAISGNTLTIRRTDGSTVHYTKTLTTNAAANPITGVQ